MRVLVVSGLWPPDVGGPASHAPELADHLLARGHEVAVVTTADAPPAARPHRVHWVSRRDPPGVRHVRAAALVARRARAADVVYATGMLGRSAAACRVARRPLVIKLTADPAFERARRWRLVSGDVEAFQHGGGGVGAALLRAVRDLELRSAAHVVCPSEFLREVALGWGLPPGRVTVLPNPAPAATDVPPREEARGRLGLGDGQVLAFVGRLTAQKSLDVALRALAEVAGATLVVAGDGPERAALEALAGELALDGRARFLGPLPRSEALAVLAAADAMLLPSAWENFPHAVVESLAVGTPVVAAAVGGVAEVVRDGENGFLVPAGDARALADAVRRIGDAEVRARLAAAAPASVARFGREHVYGRLEAILAEAAR